MAAQELDFPQLRLRRGLESIQHSPDFIKSGTGKTAKRRIYYEVPLDDFEKEQIKNFSAEIKAKDFSLPSTWSDRETLKYLYSGRFEYDKTLERLRTCVEWRTNPASRTLNKGVIDLLERGVLYTYGRDHQFRPIIIFDFGKMDFSSINAEQLLTAITTLIDVVIKHCYVPGKIEQVVAILDTRELSLTKLPFAILKQIIGTASACFPENGHKVYVVGAPFLVRMSWKVIEGLMEKSTAEKVQLVDADELKTIHQEIPPTQLEQKYGGSLPNLTTYWPPSSTFGDQLSSNQSMNREFDIMNQSLQNSRLVSPSSVASSMKNISGGDPTQKQFVQNNVLNRPRVQDDYQPIDPPQYTNERYTSAARIGDANTSESPQRKSRNPIFERKTYRDAPGQSYSPIKERDEELVRDILYSNARPSKPVPRDDRILNLRSTSPMVQKNNTEDDYFNFEHNSRTPVDKPKKALLSSAKDNVLEVLGEGRAMDKQIDAKLEAKYGDPYNNQSTPLFSSNRPGQPTEAQFRAGAEARRLSSNNQQNTLGFADNNRSINSERHYPADGYKSRGNADIQTLSTANWGNNYTTENDSAPLPKAKAAATKEPGSRSDFAPYFENEFAAFNNPELARIILQEDRILRAEFVPDEHLETDEIEQKIHVRATDGIMDLYERASHTPPRGGARSALAESTKVKNTTATRNLSNHLISRDPSEQRFESPNSMSNSSRINQQRDQLPVKKPKELKLPDDDWEDDDDDDDEGANFCGICVSRRKKNTKKALRKE